MNSETFTDAVHRVQKNLIHSNTSGLLQEILFHHYQKPGKQLRPLFGFKTASVFSIKTEQIIDWCAACEMLHNATLIHDDLQDGDTTRRAQEAVWKKYGFKQAINAGDILLTLAPKLILDSTLAAEVKIKLCELFSRMSSRIVEGQAIEFTLASQLSSSSIKETYEQCIEYKTSQLFSGLIEGIAIIGNLSSATRTDLVMLFKELGIIFQIQDDILDLYGEKKREEIGCDIKEGKISCLVVNFLSLLSTENQHILEIIMKDRNETSQDEVEYVIKEFRRCGVLVKTMQEVSLRADTVRSITSVKENQKLRKLCVETLTKIFQPISHLEFKKDSATKSL